MIEQTIDGYAGRSLLGYGHEGIDSITVLHKVLELIPPRGRFLEIGSYDGVTSGWLARRRPNVTFVCVDPYRNDVPYPDRQDPHDHAVNWMKNCGKLPNAILVVCRTDELMQLGGLGWFDVILVDGDHRHKPSKFDLKLSIDLLADDGIILLDDLIKGKGGVEHSVNEVMATERWNLTPVAGSVSMMKKI